VSCSKTPGSSRPSGSCSFPIPASLASGTYELRLHSANSFTVIATSPALSVTGGTIGATTLNINPASVTSGASVSATWSAIASPTTTDWIGLFRPGTSSQSFLEWMYVSCSKSAGAARPSGSCSFPIPASLASGAYELRLHSANGFTVIATSPALTVTGNAGGNATLSINPASVASGASVTATWSGIANPTATDWIGLHRPGTSSQGFLEWMYVSCAKTPGAARASGSCSFAIPASLASGAYELRLHSANGFTVIATSAALTVAGSAQGGRELSISFALACARHLNSRADSATACRS
jgi:uncharacterized protein YegP (UPF0339 family)